MFPWMWFWSPNFYFPFSGSVLQRIEPETEWFFAGIPAQAGDGKVEKEIFDVASYGRQIGWISEALLGMTSTDARAQAKGAQSLQSLRDIQPRIEAIKTSERSTLAAHAAAALEQLRTADPAAYEQLLASARQQAAPAPQAQARRISSKSKAS